MNILIVLLTIIFISCIGYALIRGLGFLSAKDNILALGCSYGLGVGCITAQLYLYTRLSIPWDRWWILLPWIVLFITLIIKKKFSYRPLKKNSFAIISRRNDEKSLTYIFRSKHGLLEKALLVGIILSISYTFFEATIRPVMVWDAWANWLFQAKVFFLEGGIEPALLLYMDSEYPLTINLLGTFMYLMLGQVDDTAVLLSSTAFYLFLAIAFFGAVYRQCGLRSALVFTFLLVTTQNLIRHGGRIEAGLADLPLGYFAFISVMTLFSYFKTQSIRVFWLFTILLGITAVVKFEGVSLSFFIACCAIFFIYQKRLYRHLPLLFFWIAPFTLWQIDRVFMGVPNMYFSQTHPREFSLEKSFNAFWGMIKELLTIKSWNLLWITYFYSLLFLRTKNNKEIIVLHTIILSQLTLYLLIYNVTAGNNPESSIARLLIHVTPLSLFTIALQTRLLQKK